MDESWRMKKPYLTNPNMLVPYYLMLSYCYYKENESLIDDTEYDDICKQLIEKWDTLEHWHKPLLDLESLKAGTGYDIKYPQRVVQASLSLLKESQLKPTEMD